MKLGYRKRKKKRNLVNHTIYYLETHHDEEITLEQLAEMLYVTPTYLSKTFKSTGVGPINYLIQIRLNHAKELLKNDSLSVKEVAKRLVTKMPIISVNYSKILWKISFTILR